MAQITLEGFYRYNPGILENLDLPQGLDQTILVDCIMEHSGMLFPFHQQPDYLSVNIHNWFTRKKTAFTRMLKALNAEYDPIENYDRKEEWTETPDITVTNTGGHTNTVNSNQDSNTQNQVSAFDSSTYSPDSMMETNNTADGTDTFTYQNEASHESGTRTHTGRFHGNIGVTTNQQMIEAELSLRMYDIYQTIVELFEDDFLMRNY